MKNRICVSLILLVIFLLPAQPASAQRTRGFAARISPEMELLAGVLTQTTWIRQRGPQGAGNEYYRALQEFFSAYKDHEAVKIAQELTDIGFTFDAPVAFICHLGSLPDLEVKYEYSDYIMRRADGRERLERFRLALKDLAQESNFLEFFASWQPRFDEWVAATEFDGERVVSWLEGFFGKEALEFHLLLAPAMFPGGGYGAIITNDNAEMVSFQIVREHGQSSKSPEFPTGRNLELLSLHEWGHSFVNPALERHAATVAQLTRFYRSVAKAMKQQAYGSVYIFMNEQVLRAVTALASEELYGRESYQAALDYEAQRSFYLTEEIVGVLRDYQANRELYPTFDDFIPVLLTRIDAMKPLPVRGSYNALLFGLFAVAAAMVIRRHMKRIKKSS